MGSGPQELQSRACFSAGHAASTSYWRDVAFGNGAASRGEYDGAIDRAYYGGSKFMQQTGFAAGLSGFKMGTRQMLGLVMAEVWFELRAQVPIILDTLKRQFSFEKFVEDIQSTFRGIWRRIRLRFKDFLTSFKDGIFGGIVSSLTTTVFNIFATTQKATIKIIREIWGQLCKAFKLVFFNPEKLGFADLCKAVMGVLSAAAGVTVGSIAHAQLLPLCSFPFGAELASFVGAFLRLLLAGKRLSNPSSATPVPGGRRRP